MNPIRRATPRSAVLLALWLCAALAFLTAPALAAAQTAQTASADTTGTAAPAQTPSASAAPATTVPRIGVATMQPGEIFWERFGHDALVVLDPGTGAAISYNFGFFDPEEPDFVGRFMRNDMRYRLAALPFEQDLALYREEGRGVSIQWLDLDDDQARTLAASLAENAKPENAYYRYQYFDDNCSTRVRDAIDRALGGALRRQIEGRSRGNTLRGEAVRLASPAPWMWLGFDIGLGAAADKPLPVWGEAYVPMRLAAALREVKNTQGRPLVLSEQEILPHRIAPEPAETRRNWVRWAAFGVVLGLALAGLGRRRPRVLAALALALWTLCGILAALMLFIWFGTGHTYGWGNQNLLLFNPLCWLLWLGGWRILRGREAGPWFQRLLLTVAACAVLALFLHGLPTQPQRNAHWIALMLPLHLGLLLGLRKR
ncbi:DUF4105 domain-containing protein [Lysobacter silvisoli]|uniref:lipoprotein N-acyltransferase Lnb domain-containing protein n=1 Tax=Lysobacter silvisoli TaxID=2293254 RepID=UPI003CCCC5DE